MRQYIVHIPRKIHRTKKNLPKYNVKHTGLQGVIRVIILCYTKLHMHIMYCHFGLHYSIRTPG